jgi:NDMA-dependent alcohol dehydrogenase
MRTRGAVLMSAPEPGRESKLEIVDLELDGPRENELLVKMVASGLCHSDDHIVKGDLPSLKYPICLGHEGGGVIQEVGPHTHGWEVGDHVVFSFLPACGRCRWCATGRQALCDRGRDTMRGARLDDQSSFRLSLADGGGSVGQMGGISTFSEYTTVHVASAIKVAKDLPLDKLCLLGCGVGTGWGSAIYSADVRPGDVVIVMGVGGIGINSVQGAAHAGARRVIAVDPVAFKRETALSLGATDACADIVEADALAKGLTNGQGADSAIVTVGVIRSEHVGQAFAAIRKGGTVVVTAVGSQEVGIPIPLAELTLWQKRLQGALFGSSNPTFDIPRQAEMYESGQLKLDELVTRTYTLDEVNQGYQDMHAGLNIRGVIVYD